jgi:hypothetical protein
MTSQPHPPQAEMPKSQAPQSQKPKSQAPKSQAPKRQAPKRTSVSSTEDESADPVGDGHSDAEFAAHLPTPGRPNPAPDEGDRVPDDGGHHEPVDDEDDSPKPPVRQVAHRYAFYQRRKGNTP